MGCVSSSDPRGPRLVQGETQPLCARQTGARPRRRPREGVPGFDERECCASRVACPSGCRATSARASGVTYAARWRAPHIARPPDRGGRAGERPGVAPGQASGHRARPRSNALTVDCRCDMKRFEGYGSHRDGLASPTQVLSAWQLPPRQHTAGEGVHAGAHETGKKPPRNLLTSASNSCTAARLIAAKGP